MVAALLAGGLEAGHIAGYVARLNDALLRRLLAFAEADLGPPPAPYAWVVMGSEGRMEQTLLTDQDNALVFADEAGRAGAPGTRRWPSGSTPTSRRPASRPATAATWPGTGWAPSREWVQRFAGWFEARKPQELLEASTFFDFRRSAARSTSSRSRRRCSSTARHPVFLRYLARAALELRPPNSLLLRLRESTELDLKMQGLAPIVLLARCYALEIGSRRAEHPRPARGGREGRA